MNASAKTVTFFIFFNVIYVNLKGLLSKIQYRNIAIKFRIANFWLLSQTTQKYPFTYYYIRSVPNNRTTLSIEKPAETLENALRKMKLFNSFWHRPSRNNFPQLIKLANLLEENQVVGAG